MTLATQKWPVDTPDCTVGELLLSAKIDSDRTPRIFPRESKWPRQIQNIPNP